MTQWVKDLTLLQLWRRLWLQLEFYFWPRNFHILRVHLKKKKKEKKKKNSESIRHVDKEKRIRDHNERSQQNSGI